MSNFQFSPQISLTAQNVGSKRQYRAAFYMPRGAGYSVQCKSVAFECQPDDYLAIGLRGGGDVEQGVKLILSIELPGASHDIGVVTTSQDVGDVNEFREALLDDMQRELFRVVGQLVTVSAGAPVATGNAVEVAAAPEVLVSATRRVSASWKRVGIVALVVIAVGSMAYGFLRQKAPEQDETAVAQADFSELQKRIRTEITEAAKSGKPAVNNANISNISIETMRAMGLDPGKANAGCLVGVQGK